MSRAMRVRSVPPERSRNYGEPMQPSQTPAPTLKSGELLTPKEAALLLKVAQSTLANWRSMGRGPKWKKAGGSVRYPVAEIEQFLAK